MDKSKMERDAIQVADSFADRVTDYKEWLEIKINYKAAIIAGKFQEKNKKSSFQDGNVKGTIKW